MTPVELPALIASKFQKPEGLCQWFLKCEREAMGVTPHSVLGSVPTCDLCHKFATGETRSKGGK